MEELKKYPKFKQKEECAFPDRDNCNYDYNQKSKRCPYMKCVSVGNWHCIYKKEEKDINNDNKRVEVQREEEH